MRGGAGRGTPGGPGLLRPTAPPGGRAAPPRQPRPRTDHAPKRCPGGSPKPAPPHRPDQDPSLPPGSSPDPAPPLRTNRAPKQRPGSSPRVNPAPLDFRLEVLLLALPGPQPTARQASSALVRWGKPSGPAADAVAAAGPRFREDPADSGKRPRGAGRACEGRGLWSMSWAVRWPQLVPLGPPAPAAGAGHGHSWEGFGGGSLWLGTASLGPWVGAGG